MDTDEEEFLMDDDLAFHPSLHSQASTASPNLEGGSQVQPESDVGRVGRKRKRKDNYSHKDDQLLASIWLYTSEDPIVGGNQQSDTLWNRICIDYEKQRDPRASARNVVGLENRWGLIKKDCKKFRRHFTKAEDRAESGSNKVNWLQTAREMFQALEMKHWKFDHCWGIVADHPIFAKLDVHRIPQHQDTAAYNSSPNVNFSEDGDVVRETPLHALPRPPGKYLETKRRRKGESKAAQDTNLSKMLDEWNQMDKQSKEENRIVQRESLQIQKEQMDFQREQMTRDTKLREESLKLERERMEMEAKAKFVALGLEKERMKLDAKSKEAIRKSESDRINFEIMNRDLSACTPMQRKYFEMQQVKIIAEMEKSLTS